MSGAPTSTPPRGGRTRPSRHWVSDFQHWEIATIHQLEHYLRTNRFYGLLGFVVVISGLSLGFQVDAGVAAVRVEQLYRTSEYLSNFLAYTPLWIILAAAFFGGDALSIDFSSSTGYYTLVLPIRRPVLLAGRYAAAALVTLAIAGVYYAFALAGAIYFFSASSVPWAHVATSFGVAALFALAALSVAFCVSAFLHSPAAGVLVTVLALYVGFTVLQSVLELAGLEPWFSLPYAGGAMATVLDTDFIHQQNVPLGADQYYIVWVATVTEGVLIMAGYVAAFLPLSAYLYQRKESTG